MIKFNEFVQKKEASLPLGSGKKVMNVGPDAQVWGVPGNQSNQKKPMKEGFRSWYDAKKENEQFTREELEEGFADAPEGNINKIRSFAKKKDAKLSSARVAKQADATGSVNYDNAKKNSDDSTKEIDVDKETLKNAARRS